MSKQDGLENTPATTTGMEPDQEAHLSRILVSASERINQKYRRGQAEHGGDLASHTLQWFVEASIDEAVDQLVYLLSLRERLLMVQADDL